MTGNSKKLDLAYRRYRSAGWQMQEWFRTRIIMVKPMAAGPGLSYVTLFSNGEAKHGIHRPA